MTRLANVPCPVCAKDTLHIALKCQTCGTIQQYPSAIRHAAAQRTIARVKIGATDSKNFYYGKRLSREARATRIGYDTPTEGQQRSSQFGKSRERTRT